LPSFPGLGFFFSPNLGWEGAAVFPFMKVHTATSNDTLLTTTELMQKLRRSRHTICAWVRAGRLPAVRMPAGSYAFHPADIQKRLASRSTGDRTARDEQAEALMNEWRKQYAAGTLPQWKINRIEQIQGWTWE
jgi:hypothetical protein